MAVRTGHETRGPAGSCSPRYSGQDRLETIVILSRGLELVPGDLLEGVV